MLTKYCWDMVEAEFGGLSEHNLDLMALEYNPQCDRKGSPLVISCLTLHLDLQDLTSLIKI